LLQLVHTRSFVLAKWAVELIGFNIQFELYTKDQSHEKLFLQMTSEEIELGCWVNDNQR
jgi:hypothetical protein